MNFQNEKEIKIGRPLSEDKTFEFDRILTGTATQKQTYNSVAYTIVQDVMEGYNGTIMAYGQVIY